MINGNARWLGIVLLLMMALCVAFAQVILSLKGASAEQLAPLASLGSSLNGIALGAQLYRQEVGRGP